MYCTVNDIKTLLPALDITDAGTLAMVTGIINQQSAYLAGKYPTVNIVYNPILTTLCALKCAALSIAALTSTGNIIGETNLSQYYSKQAEAIEAAIDSGAFVIVDEEGKTEFPSGFSVITY